MKTNPIKKFPTIACCGLDCGLCPTHYTKGPSKCPGCGGVDFFEKHPSCSILTCCVKNKKIETCAECHEFPCSKLKSWDVIDSFICHRKSLSNLRDIQSEGIEKFLEHQKKRIKILELLLDEYNEGRSKSFYCIATSLLSIQDLEAALKSGEQKIKDLKSNDLKGKAKIMKDILKEVAVREGIELKLRKK
jgi:hypothetical protein